MIIIVLAFLVEEKNKYKFLLASLKSLITSKNCSESHIKFVFQLSFTLIGRFPPVYVLARLSEYF
jgi:hypothetical protein